MQINTSHARGRVLAVLGPTNTGKTHFAMERMLGHASGMIGFPLRLLARENYERAVRIKGAGQVALITGEEKIIPPHARYILCTVESMPVDRRVAFLGVDEIQMCADPDRGHIFTDRLLHARGEEETMLMGAETIRPLLTRLVPGAEFMTRPRFSTLTYSGQKKITRLPARSAVVAFSAADVYAIAESLRRQRGGTAVILGALSPRTRNAQVAMYQAGEVDYLAATDAIGMGLNMDVDHVAFAATRKFDGRIPRHLTPPEMAQIAGRAGRHMNDGTFGTTGDIGPLDPELAEAVEAHRFEPLRHIYWRNSRLRFTSVAALQRSLRQTPDEPGLIRARQADDELVLNVLAADPEIARLAVHPDAVRLLWEVCRVPDFRKVMSDAHARLLGRIYRHLMAAEGGEGRLPNDWVGNHVARIDRTDGDIETLVQRIANIRTWTYISFHGAWMNNADHWRDMTRAIEDRLSDALHERLTQRFVDRRSALLVKRMKDQQALMTAVNAAGEVLVEGQRVGSLRGFRFVPDTEDAESISATASRAVNRAVAKALSGVIAARLLRLETDGDESFCLDGEDQILWHDEAVARLAAGPEPLRPGVDPLASTLLDAGSAERIRRRLVAWLEAHVSEKLAPLFKAREAPLVDAARGLVFQLSQGLGSLNRRQAERQLKALSQTDRRALRRLGIRIGRESVFLPALLRPATLPLRALLWSLGQDISATLPLPSPARVSVPLAAEIPTAFYEAIGYRPLGGVALRVDILERLAEQLWEMSRAGPFTTTVELLSLTGCRVDELAGVFTALGYRPREVDGVLRFTRRKPSRRPKRPTDPTDENSPFAKLHDLRVAMKRRA